MHSRMYRSSCMQINYRYQNQINESQFDELVQQIQAEEKKMDIPKHGSLAKVRQKILRRKNGRISVN